MIEFFWLLMRDVCVYKAENLVNPFLLLYVVLITQDLAKC